MEKKEFKKQLIVKGPYDLISQHMNCTIFLTNSQLQKCINLKNQTNRKGIGSTIFRYRKKEKEC